MKQEIHYWELPKNLYISLNEDFHKKFCSQVQKRINSRFKNCFHLILNCHKCHAYELFTRRIRFRLDEFEVLRKFTDISKHEIESNIKTIGMHEDGSIINYPELPFKMKDLFYVAAHLLFDGSSGRHGSYFYAIEKSLMNYHQRRLHSFGKNVPVNYIAKENQLYFSATISHITSKILNMHCFKSTRAILSNKMKSLAKRDKVLTDEIVRALIIDEGYIGDKIRIELNNEQLIRDLHEVIGIYYKLNKISHRCHDGYCKNSVSWALTFKPEAFKDLYKSICPLPIQYKSENLEWLNNRKERKWYRNREGVTKKSIVNSLLVKPKTMLELARQLNVRITTVRAHLKGHPTYSTALLDTSIVTKIGNKILKRGGYANPDIFGIADKVKANNFLNGRRP